MARPPETLWQQQSEGNIAWSGNESGEPRVITSELANLASLVAAAWRENQDLEQRDGAGLEMCPKGPIYVTLRVAGKRVSSAAWAEAATMQEGVITALQAAKARAPQEAINRVTAVEICSSHSYRDVPLWPNGKLTVPDDHRGILGIEFERQGQAVGYPPTAMLANNWSFPRALEDFAARTNVTAEDLAQGRVRARLFACEQTLIPLTPSVHALRMERGSSLVPIEEVTELEVRRLAELLGGWLIRAVHSNGRMTYKYWPSRLEESTANNMIRQWMAMVALIRYARTQGNTPALVDLVDRNIRYNLSQFYQDEGDRGLIVYDGSVKLGAVALAALALVEHPGRVAFAREEAALLRTVAHLWNADGSFRTFYLPPGRNDNQNFYPGEALLLWATLFETNRDPLLLQRIMTSFRHYRAWHLEETNRNPAFVPWHTQAYYLVWRETRDPDLQDFIFEMNDWLLGMQQWETAEYPDLQGRFFDPERPHFGVPHASSTGVYLEGLIDAFRLATEVEDMNRADQYRLAIRRGLRNVMQLQFRDAVDMFYVQEPDRVLGGVRTEVYHNEIRVDSVQHNLMATLKILDAFAASDFCA